MLSSCKSPAAYLQCTQARTVRSKFICRQHMFSSSVPRTSRSRWHELEMKGVFMGAAGDGETTALCFTLGWSTTRIVISNENHLLLCFSQAGLIKKDVAWLHYFVSCTFFKFQSTSYVLGFEVFNSVRNFTAK